MMGQKRNSQLCVVSTASSEKCLKQRCIILTEELNQKDQKRKAKWRDKVSFQCDICHPNVTILVKCNWETICWDVLPSRCIQRIWILSITNCYAPSNAYSQNSNYFLCTYQELDYCVDSLKITRIFAWRNWLVDSQIKQFLKLQYTECFK